jgi:hypothetical protein
VTAVRRGGLAGTALVLTVLAGGAPVEGQRVPLRDVPRPALDAVSARFPGARVVVAEREPEAGPLAFEITIRWTGRTIDVTVTAEGSILLIKTEIAARDLPGSVTRVLADAYPGAALKVVEEVVDVKGARETPSHYEILLVTAQRRTQEVRVSMDGVILPER